MRRGQSTRRSTYRRWISSTWSTTSSKPKEPTSDSPTKRNVVSAKHLFRTRYLPCTMQYFVVYPNANVCHQACVKKDKNTICPVTKQDF